MRTHPRFSPALTNRRLLAIEKRFAARIARVNTRLLLWLAEWVQLSMEPQTLPPWVEQETYQATLECHRDSFSLGWREADAEGQQAQRQRLRRRKREFAAIRRIDVEHSDEAVGGLLVTVPEVGTTLVAGTLLSDGVYTYPIPEHGLRWYETQALHLAHESSQAKLTLAQQIISAGVREGATNEAMIADLASVLRPYGLQGGLGATAAPPGTGKALEGVKAYPRYRLENIVRTETMHIYNAGHYMRQAGSDMVQGWQWMAILDDRVCEICEDRDGAFIPKAAAEDEWPPAHWSCRCVANPVWDDETAPERSVTDEDVADVAEGFGDPFRRGWVETQED